MLYIFIFFKGYTKYCRTRQYLSVCSVSSPCPLCPLFVFSTFSELMKESFNIKNIDRSAYSCRTGNAFGHASNRDEWPTQFCAQDGYPGRSMFSGDG